MSLIKSTVLIALLVFVAVSAKPKPLFKKSTSRGGNFLFSMEIYSYIIDFTLLIRILIFYLHLNFSLRWNWLCVSGKRQYGLAKLPQ